MFSKPDCPPCNAIKPMIAELKEDYSHHTWIHVDITNDPNQYTQKFGITNVPCMVLVKNDEFVIGSWKGTQLLGYLSLLKKA
jgi:thiol-disulfide isomerase/thioredoxin